MKARELIIAEITIRFSGLLPLHGSSRVHTLFEQFPLSELHGETSASPSLGKPLLARRFVCFAR